MCGWRSSRLRRTYRRHFVQLGRGVLLLPSQGMLLTYSLDYMFKKLSAGYVAKVLISRSMTRFWVLMSSSFFCAMIAAITLKMLDPFGTGKLVLFQVTYDRVISSSYSDFFLLSCWFSYVQDWHAYELFPFVLLGVFGVRVFLLVCAMLPFVAYSQDIGYLWCIFLQVELPLEPARTKRYMAQDTPCRGSITGMPIILSLALLFF